jgi:hypothetical protein
MTDPRIPESKQKEAELPDDLDQTPAETRPEEADVERETPPSDEGAASSP